MSRSVLDLVSEDVGSGEPPLVLLHGMADDRRTWDGVAPALAQCHRVLRYDLRGFGQSPQPDGPYDHGDDLLCLLDERGIADCDLLGVSWGGSVALHFTLDHPNRVRRLVLESPSIRGWDWSEEWSARVAAVENTAQKQDVDAARALWLDHPMFEGLRRQPLAFAKFATIVGGYSGRHWLNDDPHAPLLRADIERLEELTTKTLLLGGACDVEDIRLIADAIEAIAPNVVRITAPDAGHLLHLEQPETFVEAVKTFLR